MTDKTKPMHTPLPWSVRPQELDDWGIIRGSNGHLACIARQPVYNDDESLNEHRKNKTDPSHANAALIVRAVNSFEPMKEALENLTKRYCDLVNCGDCGFWEPEDEKEIIASRAAIAHAERVK